jgi:hypothetical protein
MGEAYQSLAGLFKGSKTAPAENQQGRTSEQAGHDLSPSD